jgi:hypothetical protein
MAERIPEHATSRLILEGCHSNRCVAHVHRHWGELIAYGLQSLLGPDGGTVGFLCSKAALSLYPAALVGGGET